VPLLKPCPAPLPPQIDKIWVVVPFSRPEHLARVLGNFSRQRFPGKRLILVENGRALGSVPRDTLAFVLSSAPHISHAKNEALEFVKRHGGGFFTVMDDDDWYGPSYLDEIAGFARSYAALGKQRHFISLGDDIPDPKPQLLLANRIQADLNPGSWFTGGTISGWSETALPYRAVPAEDLDWCDRMRAHGARLRGLSIYHYLYRRSYAGAVHTWTQSRQAFLDAHRHLGALEFPVTESGAVDLEIVTGDKAPPEYRVVGQERFIPTIQTHP
jgi:hypothetical protein